MFVFEKVNIHLRSVSTARENLVDEVGDGLGKPTGVVDDALRKRRREKSGRFLSHERTGTRPKRTGVGAHAVDSLFMDVQSYRSNN